VKFISCKACQSGHSEFKVVVGPRTNVDLSDEGQTF